MPRSKSSSGSALTVSIPKTRDPFVNTWLTALAPGDDGSDRFWICSYNGNAGTTGVLVTEDGGHRLYRFGSRFSGFYSAVPGDANTLWLCGDLSRVVRLSLDTGRWTEHETGVERGRPVYRGMILDPKTRKLFAYANHAAFSMDASSGRVAKSHSGIEAGHNMSYSFANGGGTWTLVTGLPGRFLLRWDPRAGTVSVRPWTQPVRPGSQAPSGMPPIRDGKGRLYLPGYGWYLPGREAFDRSGPFPEREANWFARRGELVWGAIWEQSDVDVVRWDMKHGSVQFVCKVPDCQSFNLNMTSSGKIVAVNMFGVFHRYDGASGALELSRVLPVEQVGRLDCLCRADDDHLIGTPYITQRFWRVNLRTGRGEDLGRAAPGSGEILVARKIGRKIYMAAYTGGELVEYDPAEPSRFPENPRLVAVPPGGMRPVASAVKGRVLHYACSRSYGRLGCVLTRYDTRTGQAFHVEDPVGNRQVQSLCRLPGSDALYAGTTIHGDTYKAVPVEKQATIVRFDPESLEPSEEALAPEGIEGIRLIGPLDRTRLMFIAYTADKRELWGVVEASPLSPPPREALREFPVPCRPVYAERPGHVIFIVDKRVELWDMRVPERTRVLHRIPRGWPKSYLCRVQNKSVYVAFPRKVLVLEDVL